MSIENILSPGCRSRSGSRSRIALTTSMPEITRPKTPCFPLRCGVGVYVMKNCEPLVFGPAFAIESMPGRSCLRARAPDRSEEHTSELQSHLNLVCRLLLEKKKTDIA